MDDDELRGDEDVADDVSSVGKVLDLVDAPPSVGVHATRPIAVESVGLRLGGMYRVTVEADGRARKVLGRDPRRARVTLWLGTVSGAGTDAGVLLAPTQGEAESEVSAALFLVTNVPMRLDLELVDELWVKANEAATGNIILNVITQYWSR